MYVELVLYNGLVTGSLEVSTAGSGGPFTAFDLEEPTPLIAAIESWRAAAAAALSGTYTWDVDMDDPSHPKVRFTGSGHHVRMTACLAELLGFSSTTVAAGASSDQSPRGLLRAPGVARTQPLDKAVTQLSEYRGGRSSSYTYGRAKEVRLELYLPADETEDLTQTPLGSGHGALRVTIEDNTEAFDVDDLDGRIVCYPYAPQVVDGDESGGDWTQVVILATMEDPS